MILFAGNNHLQEMPCAWRVAELHQMRFSLKSAGNYDTSIITAL
jgi:hypothetical protein